MEQGGERLAAADAHGDDTELLVATEEVLRHAQRQIAPVGRRGDPTRSRRCTG